MQSYSQLQGKKRDAFYCNLKVLLIVLVVWGHLLESCLTAPFIETLYKFIYLIHMPMFTFLNGFFIKNVKDCISQIKRCGRLYVVFQFPICISGILKGNADYLVIPYWHLWYLLALVWWGLILIAVIKLSDRFKGRGKYCLIVLAFALNLISGIWGGRVFTIGRTLSFLPWLLLGYFCPQNIRWQKYRYPGIMLCLIGLILFFMTTERLPVSFFWFADGYGSIGIINGGLSRTVCFIITFCIGIFILSWTSERKLYISTMGCDTMGVYIGHGFIVKAIQSSEWILNSPYLSLPIAIMLTVIICKMCFSTKNYCVINRKTVLT